MRYRDIEYSIVQGIGPHMEMVGQFRRGSSASGPGDDQSGGYFEGRARHRPACGQEAAAGPRSGPDQ